MRKFPRSLLGNFAFEVPEVTPSLSEGVSSGTDVVCREYSSDVVSGDYGHNKFGKEGNSRLKTARGF